ncbi:MAG: hypothetical protein L3J43_07735 [Sulfurovum sp.]|nr:hypothetical protein [Sulfurovum sp.]
MKNILLITLLLLPLWGDMDAQIEAIQRAPVAERFKLMNAFKKKIIKMHEKERIEAMTKLQSITQSKHAAKVFKEIQTKIKNNKGTSVHNEKDDEIDDLRDDDRREDRDDERNNERDDND